MFKTSIRRFSKSIPGCGKPIIGSSTRTKDWSSPPSDNCILGLTIEAVTTTSKALALTIDSLTYRSSNIDPKVVKKLQQNAESLVTITKDLHNSLKN